MAFTGANPLNVYKDLVVGAGFDWPFHLIPGNPLGVDAAPGREQPRRDARAVHAARADRLRRRLRVPLRALQHRRHGPVLGRLGLCAARGPARRRTDRHDPGDHSCRHRRRDLGRHRGRPQGLPRSARGDHHDHAQLDRDLRDAVPLRGERPADRQPGRQRRLEEHQGPGAVPGAVGRRAADPHRDLHRARLRGPVLRAPQPHDARLRGARRRLQSRGGALRRHLGQALDRRLAWRSAARSPASPGAVQVLGVNYAIPASDVPVIDIGFTGIAVALLGRNTASGVVLAALLFAALQSGGPQLSGSFTPSSQAASRTSSRARSSCSSAAS